MSAESITTQDLPAEGMSAEDMSTEDMSTPESYSMVVSYDGSPFCGFARQPGHSTVQGELEHALSLLFHREVLTVCAGRTDTGVHALGQVVSFEIAPEELEDRHLKTIRRSMNALTDDHIVIRDIGKQPAGFSARFDAKARTYKYFICNQDVPSIFLNAFTWHIPHTLNKQAMREGASYLIGEHDFKSFCMAASAEGKTTMRFVEKITIDELKIAESDILVITIKGNAFLHSMVRTIVGTLVEVGRKHKDPIWVSDVLAAKDRKAAGQNAPANGLILWSVDYR